MNAFQAQEIIRFVQKTKVVATTPIKITPTIKSVGLRTSAVVLLLLTVWGAGGCSTSKEKSVSEKQEFPKKDYTF